MSIESATFTGAIRGIAADLGRNPSETQIDMLDQVLKTLATVNPETQTVTVGDESVDVYLKREVGKFAPVATEATPATSEHVKFKVGNSVSYRKADDFFVVLTAGLDKAHDSALTAEAATWSNPWAKDQVNRTRQTIIQKTNPALAAKFKAQAGI